MALTELHLKGAYDSDRDDIVGDFYIPALSNSINYSRIAGFFSSNSLAVAARGIERLIYNGGKMQLITNVVLSTEDQNAIREALAQREVALLDDVETLSDAVKLGHIRMLAWMVKNGKLEIRVAVVPDGIEHEKVGIFEDSECNVVSFSGSDNETEAGWLRNHEEFHVFCSWIDGERDRHLSPVRDSFEALWNGNTNRVKVYPITDAFREGLVKAAPKGDSEFRVIAKEAAEALLEERRKRFVSPAPFNRSNLFDKLYPFQRDAVLKWEKNNRVGILTMATGTGKTKTAEAVMSRLLSEKKGGLVVIVVPTQLLVTQWCDELRQLGFRNITEVMKNSKDWTNELRTNINKVHLGIESEAIAVATYDSFSMEKTAEIVRESELMKVLICDEMHHSWSPGFRKGLLPDFSIRLGLSATPERYMDDKGTAEMQAYFGGVVFDFGIREAINGGFLVPYEYFAEVVTLTPSELEEYNEISGKIAKRIAMNHGDLDEITEQLLLKRSLIATNSESKWPAFEKILNSIPELSKTLIYCSPQQLDRVMGILHGRAVRFRKITFREPLSERLEIIKGFVKGDYQAIVAIRILNEGIDVPGIERAIILASSGNPIEYIQRRGRILRRSQGKTNAVIHDVLIFPWPTVPAGIPSSELSLIRKEVGRIREFTLTSRNPLEVLNKISRYAALF